MKRENLKLLITLLTALPLSAMAGKSVDQSWDIDAGAMISVENIAGETVIIGWDENKAHLTGELGDNVDELEISASGDSLEISVNNRNKRNIDETYLKLMVPHGASLDLEAVSADIQVTKMNNEKLTASSVSGDVEVEATSQWVSIESVSGDVEFAGQTRRITAESVSGDIDLSGISGEISASTVSGDMDLDAASVDSAKLETVSGDIEVACKLSNNGGLGVESMSGDVVISLPADQAGLFKAQSFSGQITSDFGSVKSAKHGPGSHLKYSTGSGGAEVRVESFSGNIELKHN